MRTIKRGIFSALMSTINSYIKTHVTHLVILTTILILSAFLRFLYLNTIPNGISGDELTYLLTIKSMWLTGSDISGTWNPWGIFIFHYPKAQIQAELPYFLYAPVVGLLPFSLFAARVTNAVISLGTVIMIYFIAKKLFSEKVGLLAACIAGVNPWFIYIGRTAYEVVPATFFFLCIFYILLVAKKWKILFVIPFIFLFFYSYIATKIILFPFLLLIIWYVYRFVNVKNDRWYYFAIIIISLILSLFYAAVILSHPNSSRIAEVITPLSPGISSQVNELRKITINTPLTSVFINKFTVYTGIITGRFFNIFSFPYLFVNGDEFFSIWSHGLFYITDLLFLVLGGVLLYVKKKTLLIFLLLGVLVSSVPHLVHGLSLNNFTPHIALLFPFFILIISFGIGESIQFLKKRSLDRIGIFLIASVYIFSLGNFLNTYFYQHPLQGYFDFNMRVASSYIQRASPANKQVDVYTPRSKDIFLKYIFYENAYNKNSAPAIRNILSTGNYTFNNIHFLSCDKNVIPHKNTVAVFDSQCGAVQNTQPHLSIKTLSDGGDAYSIFNDQLCKGRNLKPYPSNITLSDFAIEKQSNQVFCSTYIFQ